MDKSEMAAHIGQMDFPFGKHKGIKIHDIFVEDERYLRWMAGEMAVDTPLGLCLDIFLEDMS